MVEVFKTNVQQNSDAEEIIESLSRCLPDYKINFDLEDCDKILRVEARNINLEEIIKLLACSGFNCEQLEDSAVNS